MNSVIIEYSYSIHKTFPIKSNVIVFQNKYEYKEKNKIGKKGEEKWKNIQPVRQNIM